MIELPEIMRREPSAPLTVRWVVPGSPLPASCAPAVEEALRRAGLDGARRGGGSWSVNLTGRTRVWGLVPRDVEEVLEVVVLAGPEGGELTLAVIPRQTHDAHAAGLAGALVLGVTAWLAGGWLSGVPVGLTTLIAGGLWADVSRTLAFDALTARIRGLAYDLGRAVWPSSPGQLLPAKGPSRLLWWHRHR